MPSEREMLILDPNETAMLEGAILDTLVRLKSRTTMWSSMPQELRGREGLAGNSLVAAAQSMATKVFRYLRQCESQVVVAYTTEESAAKGIEVPDAQ